MSPPPSVPPADDRAPADAAAERWFFLREEGFSAAQLAEFERWRRANPRHAAAFARLEVAHAFLEKLPFAADRLADLRAPAPRPRRFQRLAGGIAAVLTLTALGVWQWPRATPPAPEFRYATSAGGYERVLLADGSTLELNSLSEAVVRFATQERLVTLVSGEAHFSVAPDSTRPFVVAAGGVAVRALGTAFNVRLATADVEVIVTHGRVSVSPRETITQDRPATADTLAIPEPAPTVAAGQRVLVSLRPDRPVSTVETVSADAIQQALAWQERKLVFSDTPLRDVVRQFNRRNRLQLVVADPALENRPVGGTFAADHVEAFVRLLEASGDIAVESRTEGEIVLRRAP